MILASFIPPMLADSDAIGTIIFLVLAGVATLVQNIIESRKKKKQKAQPPDTNERQIKDIIKSLETQAQQEERSVQKKSYPEPAPVPASSMTKLKKKPVETYTYEEPQLTPHQEAMQREAAAMYSGVAYEQSKEKKLEGQLSDVELAALNKLKSRSSVSDRSKPARVRHAQYAGGSVSSVSVKEGLANNSTLRTAMIYHEVLGKPVSLR